MAVSASGTPKKVLGTQSVKVCTTRALKRAIPHRRCTKNGQKPAFGCHQHACHGIGMDAGNKAADSAERRADEYTRDDLRCHKSSVACNRGKKIRNTKSNDTSGCTYTVT
ncbi:hypothetical protein [Methanogenium cariaci]|uniref:hypothetical protein n=1 Tax=Methanogenium cariaci TaxID=2197 RepID=UPI001FE1C7A3|nr:hypothetical protein [Methanogenium cariaci]